VQSPILFPDLMKGKSDQVSDERPTTPPLSPSAIQFAVLPWQTTRLRLGVPVIALALVLTLDLRLRGIIGAVIALGGIVLIIAIEAPVVLRSQRLRQRERLLSLPNGAFYACRGTTVLPGHRSQIAGNMILDRQGITFTPLREERPPLTVDWSEVVRLQLARSRTPVAGSLVLDKSDGTKQTFIVRGWGRLAKILTSAP
jgi:hypothetical protein